MLNPLEECHCPYLEARLVVFSNKYKGQNTNWAMMAKWKSFVEEGRYDSVKHVFLMKGNTYLPCDRDFAQIEKVARTKRGSLLYRQNGSG